MTIEIVKVQMPFTGPRDHVLVYDRERKWTSRQEPTVAVTRALRNDMHGYFRAQWMGLDGWRIVERVSDQDW